jgi:DNA transformation protein and related proteins
MNMAYDPLAQALVSFALLGQIRQRKMFGGVYIYCDDLFIATVHDAKLYFKANANTAPDFVARGLPVFSYPKQGGVATLQYYQAPQEVFSDDAAMLFWARKALFAAKQDAQMKKKPARTFSASPEVLTSKAK